MKFILILINLIKCSNLIKGLSFYEFMKLYIVIAISETISEIIFKTSEWIFYQIVESRKKFEPIFFIETFVLRANVYNRNGIFSSTNKIVKVDLLKWKMFIFLQHIVSQKLWKTSEKMKRYSHRSLRLIDRFFCSQRELIT